MVHFDFVGRTDGGRAEESNRIANDAVTAGALADNRISYLVDFVQQIARRRRKSAVLKQCRPQCYLPLTGVCFGTRDVHCSVARHHRRVK